MTQKSIAAGQYKEVPFNSIGRPKDLNSRRKLRNIPALAKSIEEKGLLVPLQVTNGGDTLTLAGGWRRAAALEHINWGSKLVPVIVVDNNVEANIIENVREDVPALDLAERLAQMAEGTYPTPEGVEPRKYSKAELAGLFPKPKSTQYVSNLIRCHNAIFDDVKAFIRTEDLDVPTRVLFAWAAIKSADKQLEVAHEWSKEQAKLEKTGKVKRAKGTKEEGEGGTGSAKPGKKVLGELFEILSWKSETAKGKEAEVAAANAQLLRFVLGEVSRLPTEVLSADDKKAYKEHLKAEEQAAADAEAEAEEAAEE